MWDGQGLVEKSSESRPAWGRDRGGEMVVWTGKDLEAFFCWRACVPITNHGWNASWINPPFYHFALLLIPLILFLEFTDPLITNNPLIKHEST